MDYRTNARPAPTTLVVKNHSAALSFLFVMVAASFALVGLFLLAGGTADATTSGGRTIGAMGLAFVLMGGLGTWVMVRQAGARTTITVDGDTVRIAFSNGTTREMRLGDFEGADVEGSPGSEGAVYCTRIVFRGSPPIYLDGARTSVRGHYDRTASEIMLFLRSR